MVPSTTAVWCWNGAVTRWRPKLGTGREDELLRQAGTVPAGADGLIMLPYLHGERAPHWSSLPSGAYIGLRAEHRRPHLIRAALEGVCMQLALVLDSVRAAGNEVREIRATGGFARSALWRQMLADVLGTPIGFPTGYEGSSFGAALLGMDALGLVPSIDVAADLVGDQRSTDARPGGGAGLWRPAAYLRPALRRIGPDVPRLATDPACRSNDVQLPC